MVVPDHLSGSCISTSRVHEAVGKAAQSCLPAQSASQPFTNRLRTQALESHDLGCKVALFLACFLCGIFTKHPSAQGVRLIKVLDSQWHKFPATWVRSTEWGARFVVLQVPALDHLVEAAGEHVRVPVRHGQPRNLQPARARSVSLCHPASTSPGPCMLSPLGFRVLGF